MPSAACAGRSSCASSRTAASLLKGSAPSNDCSRPRSPAACRGARSSSTSLRSSAPGSAATPFRCSPDSARDQLNAYIIRALCRGILLPRAPGRPADGGLDELERLKVDEAPRAAHDAALGESRDEVPRPGEVVDAAQGRADAGEHLSLIHI